MKTDILVIGGGMAGIMSAISAKRYNKNVMLISKGLIGRSGNTLVSGGGIAAATDFKENTQEKFYQDIIKSGKGIVKENLAKELAYSSLEMIKILEELGIEFIRENNKFKLRRPPGHSIPRNIPTKWKGLSYLNRGLSYTKPLIEKCIEKKLDIYEGYELIKLIKENERATGAIFVNKKNEILCVKAKSIILATGGFGYLFEKNNNTNDILGGGLAAALEIGCKLQDMEQVQFYPTMMFKPIKMTISNPLFGLGATLRNYKGEQFMKKYDENGDMATRDIMARSIFLEIENSNGEADHVYFDCTTIPAEKLKSTFTDFYNFLIERKIDPTKEFLPVSPCVHYSLGGIVIDEKCKTNIPGLLAAGEICGGVHGANRLSGAALMEAAVFGWKAGETAVKEVSEITFSEITETNLKLEYIQGFNSKKIEEELRKILWKYCSLIKSKKGLEDALKKIEALREKVPKEEMAKEIITTNFILNIGEVIVRSSLLRCESRGAHYRKDYPEISENFTSNIICYKNNDVIEIKYSHLANVSN